MTVAMLDEDIRIDRVSASREDKIDPMWAADEDDRRMAIARRAAAGARKTLAGK